MGKDREGKAEAKPKKPQAYQDRMPPASAGTAVKSGSTSMVGGSKKREREKTVAERKKKCLRSLRSGLGQPRVLFFLES